MFVNFRLTVTHLVFSMEDEDFAHRGIGTLSLVRLSGPGALRCEYANKGRKVMYCVGLRNFGVWKDDASVYDYRPFGE